VEEEDDDTEDVDNNIISRIVVTARSSITKLLVRHKKAFKSGAIVVGVGLYMAYLCVAINYTVSEGLKVDWCDGIGMFIIITGLLAWGLFYYFIIKGVFGHWIQKNVSKPLGNALRPIFSKW
jgi:pyrimidine nucleoside transport protein